MQWLTILGAVVAVLAGIGTLAVFVALGAQRGRVERLENQNEDLRNEIGDERRRRENVEADNARTREDNERLQRTVNHLQGEVDTMRSVIEGVTGPISVLAEKMSKDHALLEAHHREAMSGQHEILIGMDLMYALQADTMRLLGDQRSPGSIKAALRAREGEERHRVSPAD